ncbi:M20 family metallopeptidase, partial [Eubacteriales bacterium OttesenSCG-928-K08]|nr:M20 family metallopeptidase [Eubacteriales bacterium OttesenSCG-928-K08]
LAIAPGPVMAAMDRFIIKVKGSGGHGSAPERCVDPIWIAAQIIGALQGIVSRELAPVNSGVVSVCMVTAGSAFNIIPEEAVLEGTIRTLTEEDRAMVAQRIREIAAGVAQSLQGSAHTQIILGPPPVKNDAAMAALAANSTAKVLGEKFVQRSILNPTMVGEDVAYYLGEVPGAFFLFGTGSEKNNTHYSHHSPYFSVDEDVLWHGCAAMAQTACDYLSE